MKGIMWIALLVSGWALAGEPTKAEIERLLPGKWRGKAKQGKMKALTTYGVDHSFRLDCVIKLPDRVLNFTAAGTWKAYGQLVSITITESSDPDLVYIGQSWDRQIYALNHRSITYSDEGSPKITEKRVKE